MHQHQKQLKHLQVTVHNQVIGFRSVGGKGGPATSVKTVKRYAAKATTSSLRNINHK